MLNFSCLQNYTKVQNFLKEVVKYLRFKIASNTMLWPLTTLGYNATCPNHLFTRMPGLVMYYILVAVASLDLIYTIFLYCLAAKKPGMKDYMSPFCPFIASAICAIVGAIVVLLKSHWSVILGFNWNLSLDFELGISFGTFHMLNSVLSLMEVVSLIVKFGKKGAKAAEESEGKP